METSEPDARRQEPGRQDHAQALAVQRRGLDEDDRADEGRAEDERDRGEAARRRDDGEDLVGGVLAQQAHGEDAEAGAERDERRLGPEHDAEADRRERRQHDARQLDRLRDAGLQPLRRLVAAVPGRRTIASAVTSPARARTGSGHQTGAPWS